MQKTNDKAWIWDACDNSDDAPRLEKLCAKFTSVECKLIIFMFNYISVKLIFLVRRPM